jgi:hypothetical protein
MINNFHLLVLLNFIRLGWRMYLYIRRCQSRPLMPRTYSLNFRSIAIQTSSADSGPQNCWRMNNELLTGIEWLEISTRKSLFKLQMCMKLRFCMKLRPRPLNFWHTKNLHFCSRCRRQNETYSIVTRYECQCRYRKTLNVERIFVRSGKMFTFLVNRSVAYLRFQSTK